MVTTLIKKSEPLIAIGVDPALRKDGFWACEINREAQTATFVGFAHLGYFVAYLNEIKKRMIITVENSNEQKNLFEKMQHTGVAGAIIVGKNIVVSHAATDIANTYSLIESSISPEQKGPKITDEKMFLSLVKSEGLTLINYKGLKTEQDKRDAFKLALISERRYKMEQSVGVVRYKEG